MTIYFNLLLAEVIWCHICFVRDFSISSFSLSLSLSLWVWFNGGDSHQEARRTFPTAPNTTLRHQYQLHVNLYCSSACRDSAVPLHPTLTCWSRVVNTRNIVFLMYFFVPKTAYDLLVNNVFYNVQFVSVLFLRHIVYSSILIIFGKQLLTLLFVFMVLIKGSLIHVYFNVNFNRFF